MKTLKADIRQYGSVSLSCADHIMGSVLALIADGSEVRAREFHETIRKTRADDQSFEYCLFSGAKLRATQNRAGFYVLGYASDGSDIMRGVDELQFGFALYRAARELEKLQLKGYYSTRIVNLGIYPSKRA